MKIDFVEVQSEFPILDLMLALSIVAVCYMFFAIILSAIVSLVYPLTALQALFCVVVFRLFMYLLD